MSTAGQQKVFPAILGNALKTLNNKNRNATQQPSRGKNRHLSDVTSTLSYVFRNGIVRQISVLPGTLLSLLAMTPFNKSIRQPSSLLVQGSLTNIPSLNFSYFPTFHPMYERATKASRIRRSTCRVSAMNGRQHI